MAHYVEGGTEGLETKASNPDTNIQEWLTKNRLLKLAPYFKAEQADLDDIRTYNDEMIEFRWTLRILWIDTL